MWLTEVGCCEERRSRCDSPRLLFLSLAGRSLVKVRYMYTLWTTGVGVLSRKMNPLNYRPLVLQLAGSGGSMTPLVWTSA